jgi:hypothetical protein
MAEMAGYEIQARPNREPKAINALVDAIRKARRPIMT